MNAVVRKSLPVTDTAAIHVFGTTGTSSGTITPGMVGRTVSATTGSDPDFKSIEAAVFAYLQAKRALGATHVNSIEVAAALGLAQSRVEAALKALTKRGVKLGK